MPAYTGRHAREIPNRSYRCVWNDGVLVRNKGYNPPPVMLDSIQYLHGRSTATPEMPIPRSAAFALTEFFVAARDTTHHPSCWTRSSISMVEVRQSQKFQNPAALHSMKYQGAWIYVLISCKSGVAIAFSSVPANQGVYFSGLCRIRPLSSSVSIQRKASASSGFKTTSSPPCQPTKM